MSRLALAYRLLGLVLLLLTGATGCQKGPNSPTTGPPITVTAKTPRLQEAGNGKVRWPVAGFHDAIIVSSNTAGVPDSPTTYDLWDPASGTLTAIPGWQTAPGGRERIIGSWDDWVLVELYLSSSSEQFSFALRNLGTGEIRNVKMGANPEPPQIADGRVVWISDAAAAQEIHVYSLATGGEETIRLAPEFNAFGVGISGNRLAWFEVKDGEPGRIVTLDLASGATTGVPLPASVHGLFAVSGDGRYGATDKHDRTPGVFVFDSTTQKTTRLLDTRTGDLWIRGSYVIWEVEQDQHVAGFYDLKRRELRLVQRRSGSMPFTTSVFGNWFVWSEMPNPPPPTVAGGGMPVGPDWYYYALKLGP